MIDTMLGPVNLGQTVTLRGRQADRVAADIQISEGGVSHVLLADIDGGRQMEIYGSYQYATIDAILELQSGKAAVRLVAPGWSGDVVILGGTILNDVVEVSDPQPTTWRVGSIYVMEV